MIKIVLTSIVSIYAHALIAQTPVSGKVVDKSGTPIEGANIYIEGSYDGSSSDKNGAFSFTTSLTAQQTVSVSFLSFETFTKTMQVSEMKALNIVLREDVNSLGSVVLTAGNFSAGDNSKASVLSPLDIVTTAGAAGDYIGAFQTLPGTSNVGEDGRLFVRGGSADETNVYIDDIKVFQPYNASANNLPTRGRFSPFLFKGTNFSTGGFSAEYGDALSGVLLLNTIDTPDQDKTEISLINVGLGVGHTKKWKKNSLSINTFYLNLKPYQGVVSQRVDWIKAPVAQRVGLTAPPCLRRVRALEEANVIRGYHAELDPSRLGFALTVFAMVSLKSQAEDDLREFEQAMHALPEVREVHMLNGGDRLS